VNALLKTCFLASDFRHGERYSPQFSHGTDKGGNAMTIDFRPDGGSGQAQAAGLKLGDAPGAPATVGVLTVTPPSGDDTAPPDDPDRPKDAARIGHHDKAVIGTNALKGMADALLGKSPPPPLTPKAQKLKGEANEAKADLEAMTALKGADGRTLSQKLAAGDERVKAILIRAGYSVTADGTVSHASGKVLSAGEVDALGQSLLREAAADYQHHKASYLSLRSQLEDQLDMPSRTALDDLEAAMHRLEKGTMGTRALDSVMDGMILHLAKGGKAAAIDIGFLAQVTTGGVEEASMTPSQRSLLDDIVGRGGVIKRANGRIYLTGISPADLQAIRNTYQLLTNPTSDAARQISQALVEMVQSWGRAQAIARATGLSLQQALASRTVDVGQKPPQPAAAPEAPNAGGVQSGTAPTEGPTVTTVAAGDEETGDVAAGTDPTRAADPTEAVQMTHLKQVYDEREKEDHQHTDDKRRVALDHLTALRLDADAKAADERAARHVKEGPSV
jgi:hypothetical protein